ncbi:uncharacterized protein MELLADRAFT_105508 [Melampsora larici-populina 98AG31]|uniref:SNF2 N-terminal domain-containing protein n=1 Tax=Melampsora larici-populina (strain 98AG31 / pathotype 3-4-7) TaxID=747676 RepID=F4RIF9_MELLP|nr:uncharacterized protein MELLADRAFT_105508 [Melampsora larici-populina 98AG31]EGG07556.1 hypothetical protein MELLADRAFT_105508 [Melampsora larici-populina 98AG31]
MSSNPHLIFAGSIRSTIFRPTPASCHAPQMVVAGDTVPINLVIPPQYEETSYIGLFLKTGQCIGYVPPHFQAFLIDVLGGNKAIFVTEPAGGWTESVSNQTELLNTPIENTPRGQVTFWDNIIHGKGLFGRLTTGAITPSGSILADDMGLGKTLQTIALIAHTLEDAHSFGKKI